MFHGPLSDFQAAAALDNKEEMTRLFTSINDAMGAEANDNWRGTFESLWGQVAGQVDAIAAENIIQITSPIDDEELEEPKQHLRGHTYRVRGTLKYLPKTYSIWLVNASNDGRQWPQQAARHDPMSGSWEGRIYLSKETGTVINAVVAPPTSQQFFEYYHRHGNASPLSRIPDECENIAKVCARIPGSK